MRFDTELDEEEQELLLALIHESLGIQNHFELFLWLQGRLQVFLPHEVMIAAWGDFSLGLVYFDIVSSLPGLRTKGVAQNNLSPLLKRLFSYWESLNKTPFILNIDQGKLKENELDYDLSNDNLSNMNSAVIHGIKDCRGSHDCLYVLLNSKSIPISSKIMLGALLPYIDCALRQVDHLPEQLPEEDNVTEDLIEDATNTLLSAREIEIMNWVKNGKTNIEIGTLLDISAFTVKNHLQRIFKKLNVLNRAQAVSKFKQKSKLK